MRLRCANSISTFLRRQREVLYASVLAMSRARSRAPSWMERGIEPHIPVFDKSQHADGTFSRDDFAYDHKRDCYICPAGSN